MRVLDGTRGPGRCLKGCRGTANLSSQGPEKGREQRRGVAAGRCEDPRKCIGEEGPAGGGGRRVIRWCIQRSGQQPVSGRPAMAVKEPDPAPCLDHIARTIVKAGGCQLGPPRPLLPEEC